MKISQKSRKKLKWINKKSSNQWKTEEENQQILYMALKLNKKKTKYVNKKLLNPNGKLKKKTN